MGVRAFVVGPIVPYDQPLPDLLIKARRSRDSTLPARHTMPDASSYKSLDNSLEEAALQHGADRYISLNRALCTDAECIQYAGPGIPLQFDTMHLTNEGSLLVAQILRNTHQLP
jgi:SGNH domain (fused to AT3 domains)